MLRFYKGFHLTMTDSSMENLQLILYALILLFTFQATSGSNDQSSSSIPQQPHPNIPNPDSLTYDYSGKVYYEYASAYQDNNNLRMTADYYDQDDDYGNADAHSDNDTEQAKGKGKKKESYSEMASRLNCDKPWFWLALKCTWLDVKGNTVVERTRRNAITSVWFIGTLLIILLTCLCGSYCVYCLKFRKRFELMKLRKRSVPGRLELPSGKVVRFQPTEEEEKAFEELVKAILIQEMI